MILIWGAILGFISVVFGAYTEHVLRDIVSEEQFRYLMTAIRYNQVHAVAIIAIGFALVNKNKQLTYLKELNYSGVFLVIGTILFSFAIYFSVSLNIDALLYVTPIGGITIMIGWIMLLIFAIKLRRE